MSDPLKTKDEIEHKIFMDVLKLMANRPHDFARSVAVNLMVNSIRQTTTTLAEAERIIDFWHARAKSLLLDKHYDPTTGRRRNVFPHTQVIEPPFFVDKDRIYPTQ